MDFQIQVNVLYQNFGEKRKVCFTGFPLNTHKLTPIAMTKPGYGATANNEYLQNNPEFKRLSLRKFSDYQQCGKNFKYQFKA